MFSLARLRELRAPGQRIALKPAHYALVDRAAKTIADALAADATVYGVNTGFGKLAQTRIPPDRLRQLQRNLLLSHAAGTGEALSTDVVRLVLALKVASLARGHSGVRRELIDALVALYNQDLLPVVPAKGSVGASGDLAPLAHLSAVLIEIGRAHV